MVDRYTKVVLTVIALALSLLALQGLIPSVVAGAHGPCGSAYHKPCHIKIHGTGTDGIGDGIGVKVRGILTVRD